MVWDSKVLREKGENWVKIGSDARGENSGAHAKDPGQVLLEDAFGLEEGDDGVDGFKGSGV